MPPPSCLPARRIGPQQAQDARAAGFDGLAGTSVGDVLPHPALSAALRYNPTYMHTNFSRAFLAWEHKERHAIHDMPDFQPNEDYGVLAAMTSEDVEKEEHDDHEDNMEDDVTSTSGSYMWLSLTSTTRKPPSPKPWSCPRPRRKPKVVLARPGTGRRAHDHGGRPRSLTATSTAASPKKRGIVRWWRLLRITTCRHRLRHSASYKHCTTCRRNCIKCRTTGHQ
jgi:hypothetical protein